MGFVPPQDDDELEMRERAWRRLAEDRIQEAMANGAFDNLPGKGRPLDLRENPYVPPELRLPYKLLKDASCAPDWIELDRSVRSARERVDAFQRRHVEWLRRQVPGRDDAAVISWHRRMRQEFMRRLDDLNHQIDRLNLVVPQLVLQRPRVDAAEALRRFDAQCRAAYPPLGETPDPPD
ncbi:MAG: DUF1992 domain-containing protein [Firmicutes bacterium]|nr:DUF1992 domain-containing protein [Bacillota bacterium]